MDCSLPVSSVHEILQARRQDGLPFSPPRDLPNPGIEPMPPGYPALTGGFFAVEPLRKPIETNGMYQFLVGTIENHSTSQCFLLCAIHAYGLMKFWSEKLWRLYFSRSMVTLLHPSLHPERKTYIDY